MNPNYERDGITLYNADCLDVLPSLEANSVQCCVTSPPYFALRSYLPAGHPDKPKEIGSEVSPEAFIVTMVAVFREVRRVMREDGVCFVNLGDGYSQYNHNRGESSGTLEGNRNAVSPAAVRGLSGDVSVGHLLNIPHRVAEALRQDGWVWRQTIVWQKRCLSGGTWLYARTVKGDAPAMLKDLVRLDPATVQLWNGKQWTQVLGWTRTDTMHGQGRTGYLEIELRSGERIGCTAEHRWPTDRGVVFASDLHAGDVIDVCELPPPDTSTQLCLSDSELGWLVGFYLAEGCVTDKGMAFAIHARETEAYEKIKRLAELVGGTASYQKRSDNGAAVVVYSKTLTAFVNEYLTGDSCHNKRLSRKAWMRGNEFLASLLDGYLEGDGHWDNRKGSWIIGFTKNDGLAVDMRCLCARLGKVCVLRRVVHKCNGKAFPGWRGRIRAPSGHWNARPAGEIVAIRKSRAREFWDISVADEPNVFALASGVLSHNSPMPESVGGWAWKRCRVKVANGQSPARNGHPELRRQGEGIELPKQASTFPKAAQYVPCPGCEKCLPHGGYVLRRGSWRCTTAHEYLFLFAKTSKYFCDGEAAKEAANGGAKGSRFDSGKTGSRDGGDRTQVGYRDGAARNPRSVWTLSSEPTSDRHFATFPSELVRRCLVAGISAGGCCPTCGSPWAPVVDGGPVPTGKGSKGGQKGMDTSNRWGGWESCVSQTKTLGYRPTCTCPPAEPIGCLVLDPFSGLATTGQTARQLGARYVGIELNPEYHAIACKRIWQPPRWWIRQQKPKAKRPKPQPEQAELAFD